MHEDDKIADSYDPNVALRQTSTRMHSAMPLVEALSEALEQVRDALEAEAASVAMCAPGGGAAYLAAAGAGAEQVIGTHLGPGAGIVGHVLREGEVDITVDAVRDPRHSPDVDRLTQTQTRSMITLPLRPGGVPIGTLQVLNPIGREPYDEDDVPLAEAFAGIIGRAIVQRGEHLHWGVAPEGLRELDIRRRLAAWCESSEAFVQRLVEMAGDTEPILFVGEPGTDREAAARALHRYTEGGEAPILSIPARELATLRDAASPLSGPLGALEGGGTLVVTDLDALSADDASSMAGQLNRLMHEPGLKVYGIASERGVGAYARPFEGRVIEAPPLRQRMPDISSLIGTWVRELREPLHSRALGIEGDALESFMQAPVDDDVRGLRHRIASILFGCQGAWIRAEELIEHAVSSDGDGQAHLAALTAGLSDQRSRVRSDALRRVENQVTDGAGDLVSVLIEHLNEEQDSLRVRIIRLIGSRSDRRAVRPLVDRLAIEEDPSIQREILAALGRSGSRAAVEPLLRSIRDPNPETRATVLFALGRIGGQQARRAVEELAGDPDARVRCTAQGALYHIDYARSQGDGPSPALQARLIIAQDGVETRRIDLVDDQITVGRTHHSDLTLADPKVSKDHAVFEKVDDEWVVRDIGSTNGTLVNGERVHHQVLVAGDVVDIGGFTIRFEEELSEEPVRSEQDLANLQNLEATLFQTIVPGALMAPGRTPAPMPEQPPPPPVRDSEALRQLLEETKGGDPAARQWSARVLGEIGAAVGRLIELVRSDPDQEVRVEAARALGQTRDPQAVSPLVAQLDDRLLRFTAIEALGALRAPEAVDRLVEVVETERNSRLRRAAIRSLGQIGVPRAVEALKRSLEVPTIAADAVRALVQIGGDDAVDVLHDHLSPDDPLCADAAMALGELGAVSAVPQLVALLAAGDEGLVSRCVEALGKIGAPASAPLVEALASPVCRPAALRALSAMRNPDVAGALFKHAESSREARIALRQMGVQAVPALLDGMRRRPDIASRILASCPKVAPDSLIRLLDDPQLGPWVEALLVVSGERVVEPLSAVIAAGRSNALVGRSLRTLGSIGSVRSAPIVASKIDAPGDVGVQALRAAARIDDPMLAGFVASRWKDLDLRQRVAGAEVLAGDPSGIEAVRLAFEDSEPQVRSAGALAVSRLPVHDAAPILVRIFESDEDPHVRALAASLAREAGYLDIEDIAARIGDGSKSAAERKVTALVLTELDGDDALDAALAQLTNGAPPTVRGALLDGLARRGTEIFRHLAMRPDGEALAGAEALGELWGRLEFREEFALDAIVGIFDRGGQLAKRLLEHMSARGVESTNLLTRQLTSQVDQRHKGTLLDALIALRESRS